jgi:hypothetical protein
LCLKPYLKLASVKRAKSWVKVDSEPCVIRRSTNVYYTVNRGITYTHNSCQCNELLGLLNRHQVESPEFDYVTEPLLENLKQLNLSKVDMMSRSEVVSKYKGRWLRRYSKALSSLRDTPLRRKDFYISMFIKDDKENSAPEKAPRCIQYRQARGALCMGQFTHPLEEVLYETRDRFNTRVFGKGINLHDLADDFLKKISFFASPCFVLLDASKFDSCVDAALLNVVIKFYKSLCKTRADRRYVSYCFRHTLVNYGFTKHGVRYKTWGTRMSGDMDTGMGNSLIMYTCLTEFMKVSGVSKYSMSVNGDDSVLIIEAKDLFKVKTNMPVWKSFGFNMKFEHTYDFNKMEYCQCRPVQTDYGWVMARNPDRILARFGFSNTKYGRKGVRDYLYTSGLGEFICSYGLPIAQQLGWSVYRNNLGGKLQTLSKYDWDWFNIQRYKGREAIGNISQDTRASFEMAWGYTPDEQVRLERSFKSSFNRYLVEREYDFLQAV